MIDLAEYHVIKNPKVSVCHLAKRWPDNPTILPRRVLCGRRLNFEREAVARRWSDLLAAGTKFAGDKQCPECRDLVEGRHKRLYVDEVGNLRYRGGES
jgi:hypothetical protein